MYFRSHPKNLIFSADSVLLAHHLLCIFLVYFMQAGKRTSLCTSFSQAESTQRKIYFPPLMTCRMKMPHKQKQGSSPGWRRAWERERQSRINFKRTWIYWKTMKFYRKTWECRIMQWNIEITFWTVGKDVRLKKICADAVLLLFVLFKEVFFCLKSLRI